MRRVARRTNTWGSSFCDSNSCRASLLAAAMAAAKAGSNFFGLCLAPSRMVAKFRTNQGWGLLQVACRYKKCGPVSPPSDND